MKKVYKNLYEITIAFTKLLFYILFWWSLVFIIALSILKYFNKL